LQARPKGTRAQGHKGTRATGQQGARRNHYHDNGSNLCFCNKDKRGRCCILIKIRTHFTYGLVSRNLCFFKKGKRATGADAHFTYGLVAYARLAIDQRGYCKQRQKGKQMKSKIIKLDSASQNPENQWANSSNEMLFNFE